MSDAKHISMTVALPGPGLVKSRPHTQATQLLNIFFITSQVASQSLQKSLKIGVL